MSVDEEAQGFDVCVTQFSFEFEDESDEMAHPFSDFIVFEFCVES